MRQVTVMGSRQLGPEEAVAVRLEISRNFRVKQESNARVQRRIARLPDCPERRSVAQAMLSVEIGLVKAFWTIARQPLGGAMPVAANRCGLDYFHDRTDTHARYADAPGGKYETIAPRPSLPSARDIDLANKALDWLLLIDEEGLRKLLVVGATSKRGDAGRNISWPRIRQTMPELGGYTVRTLKHKYREALRIIVSELTLAKVA